MPKYFYKCSDCETIFEIYHSMNELKKDCTFKVKTHNEREMRKRDTLNAFIVFMI